MAARRAPAADAVAPPSSVWVRPQGAENKPAQPDSPAAAAAAAAVKKPAARLRARVRAPLSSDGYVAKEGSEALGAMEASGVSLGASSADATISLPENPPRPENLSLVENPPSPVTLSTGGWEIGEVELESRSPPFTPSPTGAVLTVICLGPCSASILILFLGNVMLSAG